MATWVYDQFDDVAGRETQWGKIETKMNNTRKTQ